MLSPDSSRVNVERAMSPHGEMFSGLQQDQYQVDPTTLLHVERLVKDRHDDLLSLGQRSCLIFKKLSRRDHEQ